MKRASFLRRCGAVALLLAAGIGGTMKNYAIVPGVSPRVDPTLISDVRLPDAWDQGFPGGMPNGYFVVGDRADYSFGTAFDSRGALYVASYNKKTVTKYEPDGAGRISLYSKTTEYRIPSAALFAIAIDRNDDLLFASCTDTEGFVGRYRFDTRTAERLVEGLTRPNQMAADAENNVYVVTETGSVLRYRDADGSVETVAGGLGNLQSCAVAPDGMIYLLSYGRFSDVPIVGVAYGGGTLWQMTPDGSVEKVWEGDDRFVWRARGVVIDDKGYVYLSGEANAWDNGNSAAIVRFDPGTRTIESVTSGMDYGTFLAYGSDGRLYQSLARDDLVIAYSEKAARLFVESDWQSDGVRVVSYGGTFEKGNGGTEMTVRIGSLTLSGSLLPTGGRVCGWIRVPCEKVPEIDNTWDGSNNGHYPLPTAVAAVGEGEVRTAVMPHRQHTRSRWPLPDVYTPAPDFRDNPEAYLVYFEWRPAGDEAPLGDDFRDDTRGEAGQSWTSASIETIDFSDSPGYAGTPEGDRLSVRLLPERGEAYAITASDAVRFSLTASVPAPGDDALCLGFSPSVGGPAGLFVQLRSSGRLTVLAKDGTGEEALFDGMISYNMLDGRWHTVSLTNDFGRYRLLLDGIAVPLGDGFDGKAADRIGYPVTVLSLGTLSRTGEIRIRTEAVMTAETIAVDPAIPKTDPVLIVLTAAALCTAAAAVVVIIRKKTPIPSASNTQ